jgi:hypothetical protein
MFTKLKMWWLIRNYGAAFQLGYESGFTSGMINAKRAAARAKSSDLIGKLQANSEAADQISGINSSIFIDRMPFNRSEVTIGAAVKTINS